MLKAIYRYKQEIPLSGILEVHCHGDTEGASEKGRCGASAVNQVKSGKTRR